MPRIARRKSTTKVYHTILRGNDRQDIFFDEQDYKKFLKEIIKTKEKYKYELYAYCLMTNHVHLVIFDKDNMISKIMQSLAVSYSSYFSKKYEKTGHLFQNRFMSKEVESSEYLINLCKYIHQNPQKAQICNVQNYKWSSYKEYIGNKKIVDTDFLLSFFGSDKSDAVNNFVKYTTNSEEGINDYVEFEFVKKMTDEQAKEKIEEILGIEEVRNIRLYNYEIRNRKIRRLKIIKGISKSQISRILGINRKIVERVLK